MCGKWKDIDLCKPTFLGVEPSVNWKDKELKKSVVLMTNKDLSIYTCLLHGLLAFKEEKSSSPIPYLFLPVTTPFFRLRLH